MPYDASPITSPVIEALREGRAKIERGWWQGSSHNEDHTKVCTVAALRWENVPCGGGLMAIGSPTTLRAQLLLQKAGGFGSGNNAWLVQWNDSPERTQADVLALYDKAIELAMGF